MGRYRSVKINGRSRSVHRVVYERHNGPIPEGLLVHHKDENPRNNAPENLQAMTHAEHSRLHNQRHPYERQCDVCGRTYAPHPTKRARSKTCSRECFRALAAQVCGSAKGTAKMTEDQVREIRRRVADGERQKALCTEFGLSAPAMSMLVNRKTWRHVD